MPVNQDQTKDFMGQLIGKVYDVITNNNPESMGPDNFIVFDPIGKMLTKDSFDFASKGVYGTPAGPTTSVAFHFPFEAADAVFDAPPLLVKAMDFNFERLELGSGSSSLSS